VSGNRVPTLQNPGEGAVFRPWREEDMAMSAEQTLPDSFTVVEHPLIQHKLTLMRRTDTPTTNFRQLLREISLLLGYEVTRGLKLVNTEIQTPLETMTAPILEGKKLCIVSILRAGNGLLDGMLDLIPNARVGHVGLYRDHKTLEPVEYYFKMPDNLGERDVIVVDPMLATGNSAAAAVTRLKQAGAKKLCFVCLLAAPEGVRTFASEHPDVPIFTAALDRELNEKGYIMPGLGDAGDRMYGTK
jgi:uracil phosphoribosyltransferase